MAGEWIDVEEEWAYWVNPETLRMPRLKKRVPVGAVLLVKRREEFVVTEYFLAGAGGLEELEGKKAAGVRLAEQALAYMRAHGMYPPGVTFKKAFKNGNVDLSYAPGDYDTFVLRLTPDLVGSAVEAFLDGLQPFSAARAPTSASGGRGRGQAEQSGDPWRVEPAKSGRAKCRSCGEKIAKAALRLGEPSYFEDRLSYKWHHLACASDRVEDPRRLEGFSGLPEEQQQTVLDTGAAPF